MLILLHKDRNTFNEMEDMYIHRSTVYILQYIVNANFKKKYRQVRQKNNIETTDAKERIEYLKNQPRPGW